MWVINVINHLTCDVIWNLRYFNIKIHNRVIVICVKAVEMENKANVRNEKEERRKRLEG